MPYPADGINCSDVISPGMREILFNPMPMDQPCLGSVSPVSSMNNPGLPSSAGIGVNLGCSESSSEYFRALDLLVPELAGVEGVPEGGGGGTAAMAAELAGVVGVPDPSPAATLSDDAVADFPEPSVADDAPADDGLGDVALALEFAAALPVPSG